MDPPPSYDEVIREQLGEPRITDPLLMPEPSIFLGVPTGNVLYYHQVGQVPPTTVKLLVSNTGNVLSHDPCLDENPELLFNYFLSHMEKPQLHVRFKGTHVESYTESITKRDGTVKHVQKDRTVVDFDFSLDLTMHILAQWTRLLCLENGQIAGSWQEVLQSYTRSKNVFKAIHMTKQPVWDYRDLQTALEYCVRAAGYIYELDITFPTDGNKVSAYHSGTLSRLSQSLLAQIMLVITCLWIIAFPIYFLTRIKNLFR